MEHLILIKQNGLIEFVSHLEKPWYFWRKPVVLSPFMSQLPYNENVRDAAAVAYPEYAPEAVSDEFLSTRKYFMIVCKARGHERYYASDARRHRNYRFYKAIDDADFFKSRLYANEVINRLRQNGYKYIAVREVYLREENDLLKPNIIVAVRDRENKRKRAMFLRDYQPDKDRLTLTDKFVYSKNYTHDEYAKLFDTLHATHKNLLLLPHIGKVPIAAKDVDGKVSVCGVFRLGAKDNG